MTKSAVISDMDGLLIDSKPQLNFLQQVHHATLDGLFNRKHNRKHEG